MLTVDKVIRYLKRRLGFGKVSLELNEEDFHELVTEDVLHEFERWMPDTNRIVINIQDETLRVTPTNRNLFWIRDPDYRSVFTILEVIPDFTMNLVQGYPIFFGATAASQAAQIASRMEQSDLSKKMSPNDITWRQERNINQLWIYAVDSMCQNFNIYYSREHATDLSTIPHEWESLFNELAYGITLQILGGIRSKYSSLNTPLGDIQVDAGIADKGTEIVNGVQEKLKASETVFFNVYVG